MCPEKKTNLIGDAVSRHFYTANDATMLNSSRFFFSTSTSFLPLFSYLCLDSTRRAMSVRDSRLCRIIGSSSSHTQEPDIRQPFVSCMHIFQQQDKNGGGGVISTQAPYRKKRKKIM